MTIHNDISLTIEKFVVLGCRLNVVGVLAEVQSYQGGIVLLGLHV